MIKPDQGSWSPSLKSNPLVQVLNTLARRLVSQEGVSIGTQEQIIIRLLWKIDEGYFGDRFKSNQAYDYESIIKVIADYYTNTKHERIKKVFLTSLVYTDKFTHVFQLVLDLALNYNDREKERYIGEIIGMEDREKEAMMPYVDQVMKRQFISPLVEQPSDSDQVIEAKEQEYLELREHFQALQQAHRELQQSHNALKNQFEQLTSENTQILHEKYELMNELGVHPTASFVEIADKFKNDVKSYEIELERLSRDVEEKNNRLQAKQEELKKISARLSSGGIWEREKKQMESLLARLEDENKRLEASELRAKTELQECKSVIEKLRGDIEAKQEQIHNLTQIKVRYKSIKQTHLQFKRSFMERMKQK